MFKFNDLWGALGVMLLLILIYLVLKNYMATTQIASTGFTGLNNLFTTLQGR